MADPALISVFVTGGILIAALVAVVVMLGNHVMEFSTADNQSALAAGSSVAVTWTEFNAMKGTLGVAVVSGVALVVSGLVAGLRAGGVIPQA